MVVGTFGLIDKVTLYRSYTREGIKIKPSVEVKYTQGDGFYLVLDTDEAALVQYKELTRMKDKQWGI